MSARRYQVQGLLGEGAFGAVYLAQSVGTGLQRQVAIKVLHKDRADSPATVGRLRDEARMLALIRHRAIVRVDDLVELDGSWSIVMEYVEGCDVGGLVRRGALPPGVALAIAEEVANALHAAWTQVSPEGTPLRLIHRDIKPSNIRLTAQGEVKLLDFGVARAEFAEREAGTTQSAFGTLVYMAPERFEGRDAHEADVYALGVSLFEMLTAYSPGKLASDPGRQPPGGPAARHWAAIASLSTELHALIARMLAYDPVNRPTARECARVLADLRPLFREPRLEDWAATVVPEQMREGKVPLRADSRTGTLLVEGAGVTAPAETRRPRTLWIVGGVVALAALFALGTAGVGLAVWSLRDASSAAPEPSTLAAPGTAAEGPLAQAVASGPPLYAEPAAPEVPRGDGGGVAGGATPPPQEDGEEAPSGRAGQAPIATGSGTKRTPPRKEAVGSVQITGDDAKVVLEGPAGRYTDLREVPPGVYSARVAFPSGDEVTIRNVPVRAGAITTFACSARFTNCTAKAE